MYITFVLNLPPPLRFDIALHINIREIYIAEPAAVLRDI